MVVQPCKQHFKSDLVLVLETNEYVCKWCGEIVHPRDQKDLPDKR